MMHLVVIFDIVSFIASLTALIVLLKGWELALERDVKLLLAGLLAFTGFYNFCLVMEWSGITKALDPFEDFAGALLPMWWAFIFYAFMQQIAGHDLKNSEERFRKLFDQSNDPIIIHRSDRILDVNQRACELLDYNKKQFHSMSIEDLHPKENRAEAQKRIKAIREKESIKFETRFIKADGATIVDVEVSSRVVDHERGIIQEIVRDITKRKQFEEALRQNRDRAQMYLDIAGVIFAVINADQSVALINRKGCEILGYKEEEIIGKNWFDHFLPIRDREKTREVFFELIKGNIKPIEYFENPILAKNNEEKVIAWHNAVLRNEKGKIFATLSSGEDITERKKAEEEKAKLQARLIQAHKMEAVGTLAGGIAHDFNNILSPIIIHSEIILEDISAENPWRYNLKEVLNAGKRAKDLVAQILTFSRESENEKKVFKVSNIIKEAFKLLRASLPATIEMQQNISAESDIVVANPVQIHQILMNLGTNAAHAMRETAGVLNVSLDNIMVESGIGNSIPDLKSGPYVRLTVRDTGHGMERSVMERIFDPYFTTKGKGEGTGMGLAVVHGIVSSHGGAIHVDSEPERGTTFDVYFPAAKRTVTKEIEQRAALPKGDERVLLVDDEKNISDALQDMLKRLGYRTTARTSSVEALEAFRFDPERFDLVITDQTMPNLTGEELVKELRQIRPDIPIILCTGFSELIDEEKSKKIGIQAFVMKPVVMSEMAATIRKVLN